MAQPIRPGTRLGHILTIVLLALAFMPTSQRVAAEDLPSNNLTIPVVWADGEATALPLPGDALVDADGDGVLDPVLAGQSFMTDGEASGPWYVQQDPNNTWRAQTGAGPAEIYAIEWNEELQAAFEVGASIPIETALWTRSDLVGFTTAPMPDISNPQVWGISGEAMAYGGASVYSPGVIVTIRQVADAFDNPVEIVVFGPQAYPAHVNNEGEVVYAMTWDTTGLPAGVYEIVAEVQTPAITFFDVWMDHGRVDETAMTTAHDILLTAPPIADQVVVLEIVAAAPDVPLDELDAAPVSADAPVQDEAPQAPPVVPPVVPQPTDEPDDGVGPVPTPDEHEGDCEGGSGGEGGHEDGGCSGGGSGNEGGGGSGGHEEVAAHRRRRGRRRLWRLRWVRRAHGCRR